MIEKRRERRKINEEELIISSGPPTEEGKNAKVWATCALLGGQSVQRSVNSAAAADLRRGNEGFFFFPPIVSWVTVTWGPLGPIGLN